MPRLYLALLAGTALKAGAWAPSTTTHTRRRRAAPSMAQRRGGGDLDLVSVPIPGLDGRATTLRRTEVDMLHDLRHHLPGDLGVGGTHVVFLPGKEQDSTAFDTALGALGVLGLHAIRADMPASSWDETMGRIHQTIGAIKEHMRDKKGELGVKGKRKAGDHNWPRLFDTEMLSWALQPVFSQLEKASSDAGLPVCDHLLLVGCEDGAWVLQAFLCELDRLGLKPRLEISMVALGSKSDTLIAKAVTAVYPERLKNVKYLSVHGSLPIYAPEDEEPIVSDPVDLNEMDAQKKAELINTDHYGYGGSGSESITCITTTDRMIEECILSSPGTGDEGSTEAWYSSPNTIVKWIVKAVI